MSKDMTLLGRWPETPLVAWPGFCEAAQERLAERTGHALSPFTLLRNGLHEQYYFTSSVEALRDHFMGMSAPEKEVFSRTLYEGYYVDAAALERFTSSLAEANMGNATTSQLQEWVRGWMLYPGRLAGPIWFAVLLDVWYSDDQSDVRGVIDQAAEARDHCANVYDVEAKPHAVRLFEEIARRVECSYEDLELLFPDEILKCLEGVAPPPDTANARREFFVTMNVGDRYRILDGEDAETAVQTVALADVGEPQQHLTGLSAYGGVVSATAKRILSPADFAKLREGDILVAYQTSISYEPLFERAAAVVTELGGATSHAAVVCSERRIPCVVGVANLLSSVRDGDRLTVDAAAGSVEIEGRS